MKYNTRNIGIIAHVDAGKTTLSERLLYYTGLIHKIGNVDDGNTTMDKDIQERNRGITISSAAVSTQWKKDDNVYNINIIDTPGHIDFAVEVERSLRVLDSVVAVFCASSGVQPQTENVWFQAEKHGTSKICFINKMDRIGADFFAVLNEIKTKLNAVPLALQIPMGAENHFEGVIDLVKMKALYWTDENGETILEKEIPSASITEANEYRVKLIETLAECDETFFEIFMDTEHTITVEMVTEAIQRVCRTGSAVPVLCGSAFKNKGVQPLLDAIVTYLPAPDQLADLQGRDPRTEETVTLARNETVSFSGLVFKVVIDKHMGRLAMLRVYSGTIKSGDTILNVRTGESFRISRILQMQSDKTLSLEEARAGDIVALTGIKDAKTGDSLSSVEKPILLEAITIPIPVIRVSIEPQTNGDEKFFGLVLAKIQEEDPSLVVERDPQTGETLLSGLGELHLEVTLEKIRLNHGIEINQGKPKVSYREILTETKIHREKLSKQNGGSGQFADITFEIGPGNDHEHGLEFVNMIKGGVIPTEFIPSVEKGFREAMENGPLKGYPLENMKVTLLDGSFHAQDSAAFDFEIAAREGFKAAAKGCNPKLMEPVMQVEIQSIEEYTGAVTADINRRRGIITSIDEKSGRKIFAAEVPLASTFGYISDLRTLTSGRASISMKLSHYALVPDFIANTLIT
ncbi:elongation factor G [Chryseobacterium bernardetii]|uniref:Elongation factor G n=2 Tax=Chryseobacterium TaxID=59732 RepID=A0A543E9C8_9FLAO|nr:MULTISPECIES: elongation factor G [Chryseobacterium]MDR6371780.1 elongation factor G [Chryseobacterium vietnamense]MDR6443268.1 elongation factor G [Chryseobacterium bernardetii]TQM18195.1 elongation factor G [Chryseobacterium aquifrigidense]